MRRFEPYLFRNTCSHRLGGFWKINVEFKNKVDMKKKTITVCNPLFWLYAVVCSFIRKERCTHEEWDMDNQIRTIKCRSCGKKAWVKEYKNLYDNGL